MVRTQTTVLFSTHILSDVERICTDVAFLNDGVIQIQGKLSEIKTAFRAEDFLLETQHSTDLLAISKSFPKVRITSDTKLTFREKDTSLYDVLGFIAQHRIPVVKLERMEPTLESLFMEVRGL